MVIELFDKDIKHIANNERQGGGSHTALEVCLARKVLKLQNAIHELNERENTYFYALKAIHCQLMKSAGPRLIESAFKDCMKNADKIFINPPFDTAKEEKKAV